METVVGDTLMFICCAYFNICDINSGGRVVR